MLCLSHALFKSVGLLELNFVPQVFWRGEFDLGIRTGTGTVVGFESGNGLMIQE